MTEKRLYGSAEMLRRTGLQWHVILQLEAAGEFPTRVDRFGEQWAADEVDEWIRNREA